MHRAKKLLIDKERGLPPPWGDSRTRGRGVVGKQAPKIKGMDRRMNTPVYEMNGIYVLYYCHHPAIKINGSTATG
jgi:hypothetical protein